MVQPTKVSKCCNAVACCEEFGVFLLQSYDWSCMGASGKGVSLRFEIGLFLILWDMRFDFIIICDSEIRQFFEIWDLRFLILWDCDFLFFEIRDFEILFFEIWDQEILDNKNFHFYSSRWWDIHFYSLRWWDPTPPYPPPCIPAAYDSTIVMSVHWELTAI